MDVLCGLFDAVASVGELLGRSEEKCTELSALATSVESISQSVRMFAGSLPAEERDTAFNSNQVFLQLASQMQRCTEIISKHRGSGGLAATDGDGAGGQQRSLQDGGANSVSAISAFKRGLVKGSRTLQEGMEVLSGRLGGLGGLLALPEDELAIIRQASQELSRLVPHLTLAIAVYHPRGLKRCYPSDPPARPPQELRRFSVPAGDAAAGMGNGFWAQGGAEGAAGGAEVPLLRLQLVSDHPTAREGPPLPALTTRELRTASAASTSSLDSAAVAAGGGGTEGAGVRRLVFGRQELRDKVPRSITLTAKNSEAPQPLQRFVSRDMFVLEVPTRPPEEDPQDSLTMATLAFGDAGAAGEEYGATLAWGCTAMATPPQPSPLASAAGLTAGGMHLRPAGTTRWCWMGKDRKADVHEGDCIAILLESPPGSSTPGPPRDLEAHEVTCLLGLDLRPPVPAC